MIRPGQPFKGWVWANLLLLVAVVAHLPTSKGLDACLSRPWLQYETGSTSQPAPVVVSLDSFEELQQHIDNATGPATFVLETTQTPLYANVPLVVNKSGITIAASLDWLSHSSSGSSAEASNTPARLNVACSGASPDGTVLQVSHAHGVKIIGLHVSGCTGSAIQLDVARRTVVRGCSFIANSNETSGGAIGALRSQLWLDGCLFQANTAGSGAGGAVIASYSHLLVTGTKFSSNSAALTGGAVAMRGRSHDAMAAAAAATAAGLPACWKDTDAVLDGVSFSTNRAKLQGGALASNGSHIIIQSSTANANRARYGGVAYLGQTAQLTIRSNSQMTENAASSSGGVVYAVSPGAKVILQGSSFSNNSGKILGGVVTAKEAAAVRLDNCVFTNNTADLAAGVVYARDADMVATGCTFNSNTAKRDGGALYCAGGCVWRLRSCTFSDNNCGANGGAIFGWNVEATISSSSLEDNSAGALGGALSVANSTLELRSCKLGSNSAYGSDAAGGGLYSQGSTLNLTDCMLAGNVASWGGAVYVTNSTLAMIGGGITNSSATGSGAALYALRSTASLVNATLSYNSAQLYGGSLYCSSSSCSLSACDVSGDAASLGGGCVWVDRGSLSMRRCHMLGCVAAAEDGGGVHASATASVDIAGCSFRRCSALKGSGGAVWLNGVSAAVVRGSLFAANQAMNGGSVYLKNSSATISSSSLINSTATVGGGIAATAGSSLTLFNGTTVAGNAAAVGGGIAVDSTQLLLDGPVTVGWNKALRPTLAAGAVTTAVAAAAAAADTAAAAAAAAVSPSALFGGQSVLRGLGGGIYAHTSKVFASELRLDRNTADRVGAGAYLDRCGAKLAHSNISRNQAAEEAGGLKFLNPAQGSALINCTVASNWCGLRGGGLAFVGVDMASEVALVGVDLIGNSASGQAGGGLWLSGPLGLLVVGGEVSGNTAGASAVAAAADGPSSSSSSSSDGTLQPAGGGMLLEGCSWAALHGVDVFGNAAFAGCGGGVALSGCAKFLLDGSTVVGNVAGSGGGLCAADLLSFLTLHNSSISSNRVLLGGLMDAAAASMAALSPTPEPHLHCGVQGTGGGLCISSQGEVLINGSSITRNQARNGGALALGLCSDSNRCNLGLVGATFLNNTAVQGGGGAVFFSSAISPDQVQCGQDYNASSITGYARGTSFPSLANLLASAAFAQSSSGGGGGGGSSRNNATAAANAAADAAAKAVAGSSSSSSSGSSSTSTSTGSTPGAGQSSSSSSSSADPPPTPASSSSGSGSSSSTTTVGGNAADGINDSVDTVGPNPSGSGSSEDDILASTPGSTGSVGGSSTVGSSDGTDSSSDSSTSTSSDSSTSTSSDSSTSTVTPGSIDSTGTDTASVGSTDTDSSPSSTTMSFGSGTATTESAHVTSTENDSSPATNMNPAAAAPVVVAPGTSAGGTPLQSKSGQVASADDDILASTESFNPRAQSSTSSSEQSSSTGDDDVQASTAGFDPAAAGIGMYSIASFPEQRPAIKAAIAGSNHAVFQANSARIAAGLAQQRGANRLGHAGNINTHQQQHKQHDRPAAATTAGVAAAVAASHRTNSSRVHAAEVLLPGTGMNDSRASGEALATGAVPDDWQLADATEGLKVITPPKQQTTSFPVGSHATASASTYSTPSTNRGAAMETAGVQPQGLESAKPAALPAQQQGGLASTQLTETAARALVVPVTLPVLQAAEKAGVHPKVTTGWQRLGSVSLSSLIDSGVVDPALLRQSWAAYPHSQAPARSAPEGTAVPKLTGWQQQFYSGLAVTLSRAASVQAARAAAATYSNAWAHGPFNPYAATCDPVQNPAACPTPRHPRNHSSDTAGNAAAPTSAQASSTAWERAAADANGSNQGRDRSLKRRLAQLDDVTTAADAAAADDVAAAVAKQDAAAVRVTDAAAPDVTAVGAPAPADASSSSFMLAGTSQCGVFAHNMATGSRAYGPVVTSRPAGLRVWGTNAGNQSNSIPVATGGMLQVQVSVVDVFGGVVSSGAADFVRIHATLTPPFGTAAANSKAKAVVSGSVVLSPVSLSALAAESQQGEEGSEVDDNGVELSGLQQLSTSNGSLILSGLQLSGMPGTNTTLWITASDPSLAPTSLPITLTSCSAGYMQLPGQCQLCPVGTFSFSTDDPLCSLCPAGATCNGTLLVPISGYWHSSPRSAQVHGCLNPAACARDALRQQQLADWQANHYGRGAIVGRPEGSLTKELAQYMQDQCSAGYTGRMCGTCAQDPTAVAENTVSHGMVNGACVSCGDRKNVIAMFALVRLYDLVLWAALTWVACKAAKAWAQAVTLNPATAAATAGSLPPASAAPGNSAGRSASKHSSSRGGSIVLASSATAAAAAANVAVWAPLQAHVSVFLDYLQMLSIISSSAASYAWPRLLKTFMAAFAFVPLGTSRWVSAECLLPYTLSYRHSIVGLLLAAALPLLYLLSSACVWIGGLIVGRTYRTPILALVVGTGLFYPLITMSALSVFSCHSLDDSSAATPGEQLSAMGLYWTLDPELKCYQGQHLQLTLGFGLPVVILVVFAWPLLLASMLWDSRFRIREQQQHPATRRRYLVRKTIKMCHQLLGVMSGFTRPRMYLWPVLVEVRKLLLCVVVVLVAGSAAAVQLYVLWGLLALVLLLEWWARPGGTWPIVGLQLMALGALQAVVYLASAFTQVSLVGSATTFAGIIIAVCLLVAVAFLLSLIAGLRANAWLITVLDADKDGKISGNDLFRSASKLLHRSNSPDSTHKQKREGGPAVAASTDSTAGSSSGSHSRRGASWRGPLVFFTKSRRAAAASGAAAAGALGDQAAAQAGDGTAGDAAAAAAQARSPASRSDPASPRGILPGLAGLAANSLPIANAAAASAAAAAAAGADADGAVPTSASIDIGMLGMLRNTHGSAALHAGQSCSVDASRYPQGFVAVDLAHLAAAANQQPGSLQQEQQQQQQRQLAASRMGRANSVGAPGARPSKMPLQTYLSVHQWLNESQALGAAATSPTAAATTDGAPYPDTRGMRCSSRSLQQSASTPAPQSAALRTSSGSYAVQRQQLLQQLQQQQLQQQQLQQRWDSDDDMGQAGHALSPNGLLADVDIGALRSVSESEPQLPRQQQRRRPTGPAAAARAREIAAASGGSSSSTVDDAGGAAAAATQQPPKSPAAAGRHLPYIALWSNIASAITGTAEASPRPADGSGAVASSRPSAVSSSHSSSRSADRQRSAGHSSRHVPPAAAVSHPSSRSSGGTKSMYGSGTVLGSGSSSMSRMRPSPFAASAVAGAVVGAASSSSVQSSPFAAAAADSGLPPVAAIAAAAAAAAAPAAASPSALRSASAPPGKGLPSAAAAALAASAAGAPSVSTGRHSAYYSVWQTAVTELSQEGSCTSKAAQQMLQQQQPGQEGIAGLPIVAERANTAPPAPVQPKRHSQYIGLWSALAEELGDGPSAVGAATPGPVVPPEAATAFAAASGTSPAATTAAAAPATAVQGNSSNSSCLPAQEPPARRPSKPNPFASFSAAAAVIGMDVGQQASAAAAAGGVQEGSQQPQQQQGEQAAAGAARPVPRHRRRPGARPRDSAGTAIESDAE